MAPRAPDGRPHPPTTAVVQVAEDGTAKLYLETELVEHAAGVDAAAVMRLLVDYAASIDAGVRVTTQMPRRDVDPPSALSGRHTHPAPAEPACSSNSGELCWKR